MTSFKGHLISAFQTFLATFLSAVGSTLLTGGAIQWTGAFWVSVLVAAVRAAVKVTIEHYGPSFIGGKNQG